MSKKTEEQDKLRKQASEIATKSARPDVKFGRPTDYKPEYCKLLYDHLASGGTIESFGGVIGSCKMTTYRWLELYEEFCDAKEKGEAERHRFYERLGLALVGGKVENGNVTAYIWLTKNILGYSDRRMIAVAARIETDGKRAQDLTADERMNEIREMTRALAEIEGTDGGSSQSA